MICGFVGRANRWLRFEGLPEFNFKEVFMLATIVRLPVLGLVVILGAVGAIAHSLPPAPLCYFQQGCDLC